MVMPNPPDGKQPLGVRDRQRGIWLVIAVAAAVVVAVMAFSFNRTELPPDVPAPDATTPDATLPVDPATDPTDGPVTDPAPEGEAPDASP